jgi:hypothetical protein
MLGNVIDTIKDPDMTGWEKFVAILTSVSMAIPMIVMTITSLKTTFAGLSVEVIKKAVVTGANTAAEVLMQKAHEKNVQSLHNSSEAL